MIQIIKRKENNQEVETLEQSCRSQISYNSDGMLAIRLIHGANEDTLIVCDKNISHEIIQFCQERLRNVIKAEVPF